MKINWTKVFDWSIVDVQKPYAVRAADKVVAYRVVVTYRFHGQDLVVFPVERDRDLVSGADLALSRATKFFETMCKKMLRNTKKK